MGDEAVVGDGEPLGHAPALSTLGNAVARQQAEAALFGETMEPVRIDRFELVRKLGQGGMGTVWMARDAELDRTVAIKFLRAAGSEEAEARLHGEAQSLAKISHPNVVPVFDVGRHEGRVWVAMELVPGKTLRDWVHDEGPAPRARLDAWVQAGRGIAAVHAAGLVHRDVKPDNVLRGDDGRVRVIDFGLVRRDGPPSLAVSGGPSSGGPSHVASRSSSSSSSSSSSQPDAPGPGTEDDAPRLTAPGAFVGTPAYAAPEQLIGDPVDARSDQFSFAMSVYEALVGSRPGRMALPQRVGDPLPRADRVASLPRRVRRALARALCEDPAHRFATMEDLLTALAPRRGARIAAAVAITGAAGLAVGAFAAQTDAPDPCEQATRALASVWDEPQRDALAQRSPALLEVVDDWSARWRSAAQATCEAVHVEQLLPESSLVPRRACLDARLDELGALLSADAKRQPDAALPRQWLTVLDDPDVCLSPALLRVDAGEVPAEIRDDVSRLRQGLVALRIGGERTSLQTRRVRAQALYDEAVPLGFAPLTGRAAQVRGQLAVLAGDDAVAQRWLGEALDVGQRYDPILAADAWLGLGELALSQSLDPARARWLGQRAQGQVKALESAQGRGAMVQVQRGRADLLEGNLAEASTHLQAAVERLGALGPASAWLHAAALRQLSVVTDMRGDQARALELVAQARELEADLGQGRRPLHEGEGLLNEAYAQLDAGQYEAAEASFREALPVLAAEYGRGSEQVATAHVALSALFDAAGDVASARWHAQRADAVLSRIDPAHPDRMYSLGALATGSYRARNFEESAAAYRRALTIAERRLPPGSTDLASARVNLAEAYVELQRSADAGVLLRQAVPVLQREFGEDHVELALPYKALGAVALAQGEVAEGLRWLQRALAVFQSAPSSEVEQAETRWLLAKTHRAAGNEDAAVAEASAAREAFKSLGPAWRARADEIDRWLTE